ncbi:MAG: ComEC/Rec2 family competence protein [Alphaproteobacteria bacterium]|nr:ComEC/Rec2 family competence protein [Alphaproteobacteria bacterium]
MTLCQNKAPYETFEKRQIFSAKIFSPGSNVNFCQNLLARFFSALTAEAAHQSGRLFIWSPVFVALGIAFYFVLPAEPPLLAGVLLTSSAAALLLCLRNHAIFKIILTVFLCASLGFLAAEIKTARVHTPILSKKLAPVQIEGTIEHLEPLANNKGYRSVLKDVKIERLPANETPKKIRLKLRPGTDLKPGQSIKVLAGLSPPGGPSLPGGFDYRRHLYFQGIGAVGFSYGKAVVLEETTGDAPYSAVMRKLRFQIGEQINHLMPRQEASISNALMTGTRAAIEEKDAQAIRAAGLAHMLAISGLHIGLFFGVVFFAIRFGLALSPFIALRYPIKKIAAAIAMLAASFYAMISGNSVPTQRSILMMGIIFLAILLERSPISIRLVAFAALCILLLSPESLEGPSFQMSFSAVAALIVFYESAQNRRLFFPQKARGPLYKSALYFLGIVMTSLIATLATAPFTLYHFQTLPVYGVIANMLAIPVLGFIVIPAAVAAFALMPVGLSWLVTPLIAKGVAAILAIAHYVADLKHAVFLGHMWPSSALILFSISFVIFLLLRARMKLLGIIPLLLCMIFVLGVKQPDILISSDSSLFAVTGHERTLMLSSLRKGRFIRENWLQALAIKPQHAKKWPEEGARQDLNCGDQGCRLSRNGYKVAFLKKKDIFEEECLWADILIAPFPLASCKGKISIDRYDTRAAGAYALYLRQKLVIKTAEKSKQKRPWE